MVAIALAGSQQRRRCLGWRCTSVRLVSSGVLYLTQHTPVGSIYGAFQSYARAVYAEIIPRGEEARWFSLYSITDKVRLLLPVSSSRLIRTQSSSFIGPLCVGLIADATGNIRFGFFFIVIMMWLSVPVLLTVDVEQGRIDARHVSDERDGSQLRRTGGTSESV